MHVCDVVSGTPVFSLGGAAIWAESMWVFSRIQSQTPARAACASHPESPLKVSLVRGSLEGER